MQSSKNQHFQFKWSKTWNLGRVYDCNGSIKELTKYKKGIKTGCYRSFYEVGKIETKGKYKKGKEVGVWKLWDVDGVLLRKWGIRNDTVIRGRIRQPAKI